MSLTEFQRALADLIASPQQCLAARSDPDAAFQGYELTERETWRLQAMALDEGMSINCTLYRVNRLIPVHAVLPLTCAWLGERLLPELEAYWASSRDATLQYRREAWRFGAWLQQRIARGDQPGGPVEDALRFDLASFDLRSDSAASHAASVHPHPRQRLLRFTYDPQSVVDPPPEAIRDSVRPSEREEWVLLDATGASLQVIRMTDAPSPIRGGADMVGSLPGTSRSTA